MLELVALGRFLRRSVQSASTFDFSLALAIVERIRQTLQTSPKTQASFPTIVEGYSALQEVVSLTSGTGLTAIWRMFAPGYRGVESSESKIVALQGASRRLPYTNNIISTFNVCTTRSLLIASA